MKQGKPLITFVIVLLAAALGCYILYSVWRTFEDPFTTTYAYEYELNDSVETEGLIVRSERVLTGGTGIVEVTRGEGEQVGIGQTVAMVYRDDQAQQAQEQQESLAMEITQLRYAIGQAASDVYKRQTRGSFRPWWTCGAPPPRMITAPWRTGCWRSRGACCAGSTPMGPS